jgi:hypothetical protein
MNEFPSKGGGSEGRRGYNFQDLSAAYYSLTDKPDFLTKYPTEFRIERPSDFSFKISYDDYIGAHYFEVKHIDSGHFKWSKFKSEVLPKLTEIADEEVGDKNKNSFHLITNVSFNKRLDGFFNNLDKLRDGRIQWPSLTARYEKRNVDQIQKSANIDDGEKLARVVSRMFGHSKSKEFLTKSLENYIRECNTPGKHRKYTRELLHLIHKKDDGVIRKVDIERELDFSLRKRSTSTDSSSSASLEDLSDDIERVQSEMSSRDIEVTQPYDWRSVGNEFMNRLAEEETVSEDVVESIQTSYDEKIKELKEIREREEMLVHSASRTLDRAIDLADDRSETSSSGTSISEPEGGDLNV